MSGANESLVLRWARWQTRALVRVWPGESRSWGEAIAAEAEEIEQPLAAVSWALGGATVYMRALGGHLLEWLKMPVGQRGGAAAGAPGPKRSRLFAVAVLACAAGLLCLPEGREAVRTVIGSWENFAEVDASRGELEKLAARAEKANDAKELAFVALTTDDEKQATDLADRAVKLDPGLSWIYEAKSFWPSDTTTAREWIAKAQLTDPQNALPYLRAASAIANKAYLNMEKQHSPTETEVNQMLIGNPQWMALMDQAFRAPIFKSFYSDDQALSREIWRRNPQLSMVAVLPALWRHAIPDLMSLERYTKMLVKQAEDERAAGRLARAEELLNEAESFSKRLEEDSERNGQFESFGLALERESQLGWKTFYEETGETAKAQEAAQQAHQMEQRGAEIVREAQQRWRQRNRFAWNGWMVQLSGLLMVLSLLVAGVGIGLFEVWPTVAKSTTRARRGLSWLADFAPATVLAMSVAFVLSFLPYARAMAAFREGSSGRADLIQLSTVFWSLAGVTTSLGGPSTEVLGWTVLVAVLSLVAAMILARMVYRAMRKTAPQA